MLFLYYAALLYFALLSSAKIGDPVVVKSSSYKYEPPLPKEGNIYGISHSPIVSYDYNFCSFSKGTVFYRTQRGGLLQSGALRHSTSVPSQETQGLPSLQLCHFSIPLPKYLTLREETTKLVEKEFACEITFRRENRNDFTTSL